METITSYIFTYSDGQGLQFTVEGLMDSNLYPVDTHWAADQDAVDSATGFLAGLPSGWSVTVTKTVVETDRTTTTLYPV